MSDTSVQKIPKPVMRGMHAAATKLHLGISIAVSVSAAGLYWYFVKRQRKINYENFYKTYDIEKEDQRLKKAGIIPDFSKISSAEELFKRDD